MLIFQDIKEVVNVQEALTRELYSEGTVENRQTPSQINFKQRPNILSAVVGKIRDYRNVLLYGRAGLSLMISADSAYAQSRNTVRDMVKYYSDMLDRTYKEEEPFYEIRTNSGSAPQEIMVAECEIQKRGDLTGVLVPLISYLEKLPQGNDQNTLRKALNAVERAHEKMKDINVRECGSLYADRSKGSGAEQATDTNDVYEQKIQNARTIGEVKRTVDDLTYIAFSNWQYFEQNNNTECATGWRSVEKDLSELQTEIASKLKSNAVSPDYSGQYTQSARERLLSSYREGEEVNERCSGNKQETAQQQTKTEKASRAGTDTEKEKIDGNKTCSYPEILNPKQLRDSFDISYSGITMAVYATVCYPGKMLVNHEWPIYLRFEIPDPETAGYPAYFNTGSISIAVDDVACRVLEPLPMHFFNIQNSSWERPVRDVEKSFFEEHGTGLTQSLITELIPFYGVFEVLRELSRKDRPFPAVFYDAENYDVFSMPFVGVSLPFVQKQQLATAIETTIPLVWKYVPEHDVHIFFKSYIGNQPLNMNEEPDIEKHYVLRMQNDGTVRCERVREETEELQR